MTLIKIKISMLYKQLQDAGLNETEAKIYLATLELGQTTVSRIARKAGIKRTTVYLSLESLKEKALISAIKKYNKTSYYAEDPRNLERIMEERKQRVSNLIPKLLSFTNLIDKKPEIRYFDGEEGIKGVVMDSIKHGTKEILSFFSETYISDFSEQFYEDVYRPARIKNKISGRALTPDIPKMKSLASHDATSLRQTKFLPHNLFKINIQIMLYEKNKVSIISFKEKFALIIDSQSIYESFKSIFETLWATAK